MKAKTKIKQQLPLFIQALLFLVVGILFCCSLAMGSQAISILVGSLFVILAAAFLFTSVYYHHGILSSDGIASGFFLSIGILCFIENIVLTILTRVIPVLLIVLGAYAIVDAVYKLMTKGDRNTILFEVIFGVIALTLGLLLMFVEAFQNYAGLLIGIIFIIYSGLMIYMLVTDKKVIIR